MLKADSPDIHFGLGVVREGSQQSVVFRCSALACQVLEGGRQWELLSACAVLHHVLVVVCSTRS